MKKIIITVMTLLLLASCGNRQTKTVQDTPEQTDTVLVDTAAVDMTSQTH